MTNVGADLIRPSKRKIRSSPTTNLIIMNFSTDPHQQIVKKPWGEEVIYAPGGLPYTGKILKVLAGKRLSFQYHDEKIETLCLISGQALVWLEDEHGEVKKITMEPEKGYTVRPPQKHRVEAITDCQILEASMPETGNTFRLEDDYKRDTETEEVRKQLDRGWKT